MRPVIFDYAINQQKDEFPQVIYDHSQDLSMLDGCIFIDQSDATVNTVTKTKVNRETDDSPFSNPLIHVTKTFSEREADDNPVNPALFQVSKTDTKREVDDAHDYNLLTLMTKTENSRESDE